MDLWVSKVRKNSKFLFCNKLDKNFKLGSDGPQGIQGEIGGFGPKGSFGPEGQKGETGQPGESLKIFIEKSELFSFI